MLGLLLEGLSLLVVLSMLSLTALRALLGVLLRAWLGFFMGRGGCMGGVVVLFFDCGGGMGFGLWRGDGKSGEW